MRWSVGLFFLLTFWIPSKLLAILTHKCPWQEEPIQNLIKAATAAKEHAYCPYSNFRVGSAVLCTDGSIFSGCNVENASYSNCVCAERVAIMNAVSHGHRKFKASAVACDIKDEFKGPCGICRQAYAEFGLDIELYLVKPDLTVKKVIIGDLLPMAFTPQSLQKDRI